jgi:hypothetical protein
MSLIPNKTGVELLTPIASQLERQWHSRLPVPWQAQQNKKLLDSKDHPRFQGWH